MSMSWRANATRSDEEAMSRQHCLSASERGSEPADDFVDRMGINSVPFRLARIDELAMLASSHYLTGSIGIVATTSADYKDLRRQLLPWMLYHASSGVSRFYLLYDGRDDRVVRALARTRCVTLMHVHEPWASKLEAQALEAALRANPGGNFRLMAVQSLGAQRALVHARSDGVRWLAHIDPDELLYLEGAANSLPGYFASLPDSTSSIRFMNHEAQAEEVDVVNPYEQVTLFRTHKHFVTPEAHYHRSHYKLGDSPTFLLLYANGKSAIRTDAPKAKPYGPHFWHAQSSPRWIAPDNPNGTFHASVSDELVVLHYAYTRVEDVIDKAKRSCPQHLEQPTGKAGNRERPHAARANAASVASMIAENALKGDGHGVVDTALKGDGHGAVDTALKGDGHGVVGTAPLPPDGSSRGAIIHPHERVVVGAGAIGTANAGGGATLDASAAREGSSAATLATKLATTADATLLSPPPPTAPPAASTDPRQDVKGARLKSGESLRVGGSTRLDAGADPRISIDGLSLVDDSGKAADLDRRKRVAAREAREARRASLTSSLKSRLRDPNVNPKTLSALLDEATKLVDEEDASNDDRRTGSARKRMLAEGAHAAAGNAAFHRALSAETVHAASDAASRRALRAEALAAPEPYWVRPPDYGALKRDCFIIDVDRDAFVAARRGPEAARQFFMERMALCEGSRVRCLDIDGRPHAWCTIVDVARYTHIMLKLGLYKRIRGPAIVLAEEERVIQRSIVDAANDPRTNERREQGDAWLAGEKDAANLLSVAELAQRAEAP